MQSRKPLEPGATHFCWSADIPVRFGVDQNEEADKNVRAPKAQRLPMFDQSKMHPLEPAG
jgi:hypothetical protein